MKISPIRTNKLIKLCEYCGWKRDRIKGDHLALVKNNCPRPIIIPLKKTSPVWLVMQVIKELGISNRDDFFKLLRKL